MTGGLFQNLGLYGGLFEYGGLIGTGGLNEDLRYLYIYILYTERHRMSSILMADRRIRTQDLQDWNPLCHSSFFLFLVSFSDFVFSISNPEYYVVRSIIFDGV